MKLINAGIELATLFQRYARKVLMREGEGIMKIPSKKKVNDFAENIYQDFKSSGVPNNVIKTEKDIGKFHKQITDIEEKARKKWWDNQLKKPPELADIFDLQGNQIRDTSKIMGGKEIPTGIKTLNTVPEKKGMSGYEYEIKNPKKLDPALYEDRGGNIIPAQFGIHPNSEIAKSLRLEAEAAKKLKNMSEAEIKLRGNRPYDTDEQILARLKKQNKESNVAGMRPTDDTLNKLVDEHSSNLEKLRQTDAEGGTAIGYEEFKALQKRNAQIEEVIKNARKVENETEEQILNKLNKGNKESIERLKNKPLDPDVVLPNYNETPGAYSRRKTPGSKENLLQELKIAYEKEFNRLRGDETAEELKEILKNLDTDGVPFAAGGRAGLYQGGQAQIEPDLSGIGHGSDALMARNMLIAPGSQATTSTGLNYLLGEDNDTTRVPYKEKGSVTLADLIKVNASGNKSGKNQIMGAPDGITADTETFNAIIKMDIPIMEKINLLGSYGYGKDRFKVEKGNKELFLGEDGYKDRNIGLGFNQDGEGLSGSVIRNLETGDNDYQLKLLKSFAEGGRIGYNEGNMVLPKPKAMDEYLLKQVMSQAGANTLDVRTREMFIEQLKKKIRDKRATEEKKYQFEELRDQGAEDMYYDNREKELDIKYNPQNYPPSMRKFAGGGLAGLLGEGPGSTDREPRTFNQGERVPMLYGGGIYKVIIENLSKLRKIKPSEYLKLRNYKSLPTNVKNLMPKTELEKLKEARIEMVENLVDMATTSKSYEKNIKNVADEFSKMGLDGDDYLNMMRKDLKSPVPFGVTDKDILQGELILKNLKTKGNRQLNAQGGRIGYEEAGVVDKIGGMVNYKNVPHYLAKPLKGVTNIAEWMGRLPFATAELASDIIRKPLFKPGDRVPGLPGLGARFVGDETFKKFINNMTTGALAENLGLTALADKTGENLTDEARTVGDILESLGEFANAGGLLAAGKNLLKGKGVGDVVKKIKKRLKENKDEALTAQGEGRRDFNKTAAAGAGVIALKSMGLGSLTKQTKKLDDIQIQVRGDQDYDYADEMWNGSTWANIQFKALTKKGTEILEDLTKAKGSTLTKEGGLYTPVGGSEEAAMIVQKLKPKAGLQLHMATNQVYNPATKSFSHPKGSIQEAAGKEHNKIYSGKDINKKKIMKEADDMIAHDSGGYSSMQFHDEYLDDILEQLAVK
jgi:hypothetical protein